MSPTAATTPDHHHIADLAYRVSTARSATTSTEQSYTVTGANLSSDITVTAPTGFEVSLDYRNWFRIFREPGNQRWHRSMYG